MFENIEAERIRHKMSLRSFAEMLGVTERTVWNWKNKVTDIPASKVVLVAREFGCTTDYLLGLAPKK